MNYVRRFFDWAYCDWCTVVGPVVVGGMAATLCEDLPQWVGYAIAAAAALTSGHFYNRVIRRSFEEGKAAAYNALRERMVMLTRREVRGPACGTRPAGDD